MTSSLRSLLWPRHAALALAVICIGFALRFAFSNEVPVGTVKGHVLLAENKHALGGAEITFYPITAGGGRGDVRRHRFVVSNDDGQFTVTHLPAGDYHVYANSDSHDVQNLSVSVQEGKTTPLELTLTRSKPEFALKEHQRVFGTQEKANLGFSGYVDTKKAERDSVHMRLYRTRLSTLLENPDNEQRLDSVGRSYDPTPTLPKELLYPKVGTAPQIVQERDIPITEGDKEGFFYQKLNFEKLPTGLYLLDLTHAKNSVCSWILVTDTALIVKRSQNQILAYAVDMQSGQPLPNSAVRAYRNGTVVAQSRTDAQGLASLAIPRTAPKRHVSSADGGDEGGDEADTADAAKITTLAIRGDDEAIITRDYFRNEDAGSFVVHAYTDRTIYRPGQKIAFKGIVRRIRDRDAVEPTQRYAVPANEPVTVEIRDKDSERILLTKLTTNRYGSFNGSVTLDPEAATGIYTLITTIRGEEHTHQIVIASYQKPEFSVTVTPDKTRYRRGETVSMTVAAQYYFGAPVVGAKVKYSVYSSPDYSALSDDNSDDSDSSTEPDEAGFGGDSESYYGEVQADGAATLDENGKAVIHFVAKGDSSSEGAPADNYNVNATVTEGEDREVSADGTATVVAGDFRLAVKPDGSVAAPGEVTNVNLTAKDHDGKPVANVAVELEMGYHEWNRIRNDEEGKFAYHYTLAGTLHATTGPDGRVTIPVVAPRAGELYLKARAFDSGHRKIISTSYIWIAADQGGDLNTEYADLSLLTDKKHYHPGDTARVLINSSRIGQTVLLTVEGNRVYATQSVVVKQHSTIVHVPLPANYGPNVFLDACYVRQKHYATSETSLRVATPGQGINVKITADRDMGRASGDVPPMGSTEKLTKLDPNAQYASTPVPKPVLARYAPGDKIRYTVQTTDQQGHPVPAELSFGVVDESIYALRKDDPRALRDSFFPNRDNRVSTEYSFAIQYLGDADKAEPQISARKKFPDTAYWNPTLVTDANGLATVSFALPDNLTTWRATATAHTLDTRLGRTTEQVLVSKDFLVRLQTPRSLTQHDVSRVVALVHNDTGVTQTAQVHLTAENLTVNGPAVQSLTLESGKAGEAVWNVTADGYGAAKLRVTAYTPKTNNVQFTDGVETSLPIRPHGREVVTAFAGEVTAKNPETEVVRLDPKAVPELSRLTVHVTPSIAGSLVGATDYLIGFPYGCTEQTMSRFLPDLLVERVLKLHGMSDVKRREQLPRMVHAGLNRLYRFQHANTGGWGWWEHDADDSWMTAYVLYGLATARNEGYTVTDNAMHKGKVAAMKMAQDPKISPDNAAFLLYALALNGDSATARSEFDRVLRSHPNGTGYAYLVLTAKLIGTDPGAALALMNRQSEWADGTLHWRRRSDWYWWDWDDSEMTAIALRAQLAVNPTDPRVGGMLRWLMLHRTGDYWGSTRDTSWALSAFCDYLKAQSGFVAGGQVTIKLNGVVRQTYTLTPDLLKEPQLTLHVPASELRSDKNDVTLERSGGSSPIFYSVEWKQTVATEDMPAVSPPAVKGETLTVTREYLRLKPQKVGMDSWSLQTEPTNHHLAQGDRIRVRLTIDAPRDMAYVLIEDPFPSGCEVNERGDASEVVEWGYWWQGIDVRDDHIAFFAKTITKGKHVIEYNLRAQTPGSYHVLPTLVQGMYTPETRAETAEARVEIK
ncbi:MAG: Large extracellular alpha-helical protein [Chthonomonadaceae bacterium]|nr:Large extracellular alpha-helical protein [Chthonomonadaceae bacterium]